MSVNTRTTGFYERYLDLTQLLLLIAKTAKFDAVVTDLNKPIMDGIELVKNLRMLPSYKYTPLLILTTESAANKKT